MEITIGSGAADYATNDPYKYTRIDRHGVASGTGKITTMELWLAVSGTGVKMGTFYGSATSYTNRDYETLGSVSAGSKQTFTGLDCDCQAGDVLGSYGATGSLESENHGTLKHLYKSGDQFGAGTVSYTESAAATRQGMYGTGSTVFIGAIMKSNFIPSFLGGN